MSLCLPPVVHAPAEGEPELNRNVFDLIRGPCSILLPLLISLSLRRWLTPKSSGWQHRDLAQNSGSGDERDKCMSNVAQEKR